MSLSSCRVKGEMKYPNGMKVLYRKNLALTLLVAMVFYYSTRFASYNYADQSFSLRGGSVKNSKLYRPETIVLHQPALPTTFESFLGAHPINALMDMGKTERCDLYFENLPDDWNCPNFNDEFLYNMDIYNGKEFFNNKYKKLKEDEEDFDKIVSDIFSQFEENESTNQKIEKALLDAVYNLRTYSTCYIGNDQLEGCSKLDAKMFPWFSFKSPVYERWDGKKVDNYAYMRTYYPDSVYKQLLNYNSGSCFWNKFIKEMYGKGIVISITDKFVPEAVNLIKLLRFYENTYPIQFVHKGDLSADSKRKLIDISRKEIVLQDSVTIKEYKQDVWFVDTLPCIKEEYIKYFNSYANKWLAVLFNSFEEVLLMDTDVALFVEPAYFFSLQGYQEKGAFFFKDRYGIDSVAKQFPKMWEKLLPSMMETMLFEIPQLSNQTLQNEFFTKNSRHIMESGVVVMNRKNHLPGLLLSTQIQLWQPLTVKLHGEKDLFWLGQSMMGNEGYAFNTHFSGAAGELVEQDFEQANLVVSAAPAHLDPTDNRTILWLNSGLTYCKKNSWEADANSVFKDKYNAEELRKKYQSLVKIDALIVPPEVWKLRDKDSNELDASAKEPKYSWRLRWDLGCGGYLWSAHSVVDEVKGLEVRYTAEETEKFDNIAKIWGANIAKVQ